LANGVWAAIHRDGGSAICNAGIIDLGDQTLVVDTLLTTQAANDLRLAAETLTGRPVGKVLNTHAHDDHTVGNQVFDPDVDIISTETAFEEMAAAVDKTSDEFREHVSTSLKEMEAEMLSTKNAKRQRFLSFLFPWYRALNVELDLLTNRVPNLTFSDRLVLYGPERRAEVLALGHAHSRADSVLYLPDDRIIFMGDMLLIRSHPFMGTGDMDSWLQILDSIKELGLDYVVPGHGPVGITGDIDEFQEYMRTCKKLAQDVINESDGEAGLEQVSIPEKYQDWGMATFFDSNIEFLFQMLSEQ
jgi:glyoxylase-like metal-dependent hydrolase (beta-lactamase superfamily II)